MVSLKEIDAKELDSFRKPNVASLVPVLRDLNFTNFMGIPNKIYSIIENGAFWGVLYRTRDSNEEKNIAVLLSFGEEIVAYLESITAGSTTMFCPSLQQFSNLPYFDGGIYRKICNYNSSTNKLFTKRCARIPTLSCAKEIINSASLPTSDIEKYISWLDCNTDKYVVFEEEKIASILCILKEPENIISFYWDSDESGANLSGLINYCSNHYNELYAMAPKERHDYLAQNEFLCACNWRLFYNGI